VACGDITRVHSDECLDLIVAFSDGTTGGGVAA
jgi:hypothetical protein